MIAGTSGALPPLLAGAAARPEGPLEGLRLSPAALIAPAVDLQETPGGRVPLSAGGAPQNWSPYAPSGFTWGQTALQPRFDSVAVGAFPGIVVNQSGNVTLRVGGAWNPAPATTLDRDWVLAVLVANGAAAARTILPNASVVVAINASQVPARFFFGLPSPVNFASSTSTAYINATMPNGTTARVNLSAASGGVSLALRQTVLPVATNSVWFNATGSYDPGDILSAGQNQTLVVPLNGLPAVTVRTGEVVRWTGPGLFPGARAAVVATVVPGGGPQGNQTLVVWTRGSPESGLYLNASVSPEIASRGANLTVSGTVGNRSLAASNAWTVNTTAALPPNHFRENCTSLQRLQNGSWRLFCAFSTTGPNQTWGVDSAFSADGRTWAWEQGIRHQVCGGAHSILGLQVVRDPKGLLRMFYTGNETPPVCGTNAAVHVSSATSNDEGITWTLENEDYGDITRLIACPTPDGWIRYYIEAGGFNFTYLTDFVSGAFEAVNLTTELPRTIYLLTDGTYKMYYGTTAVYSRTSANGVNWSLPLLEVDAWNGDIEAGPLLDRGDGALTLLLYSQTGGLFLATLNATGSTATVDAAGWTADGTAFGAPPQTSAPDGSFTLNATLPSGGPLGTYRIEATTWFAALAFSGRTVNAPPSWAGPTAYSAVEDVPFVIDLVASLFDSDPNDVLAVNVTAAWGNRTGDNLTLVFPEGVLAGEVFGNVTDGLDTVPFRLDFTVSPVNDPPLGSSRPCATPLSRTPFRSSTSLGRSATRRRRGKSSCSKQTSRGRR